jgi:peroxiredoxin Q/BCP
VRDARKELKKAGVEVVGISPDKPAIQDRFDRKNDLGFPLLSDPDRKVAKAYGAWGKKMMYGKERWGIVRSAFAIDEKGKIAGALYKVKPEETVPGARRAFGI